MTQSVMVIAPHPDDEAIGCGGAICLHRQCGDQVHVVFLTSGERGIPGVSEEIARTIREAEARKAGKMLLLENMTFLRLPDLALSEQMERAGQQIRAVFES